MLRPLSPLLFLIFLTAAAPVPSIPVQREHQWQRAGNPAAIDYDRAILRIKALESGRNFEKNLHTTYAAFNWAGRTAALNYVCRGTFVAARCRTLVFRALVDPALVVRDHALRIVISQDQFSTEDKRKACNAALKDERNYRKGLPLWIVDRARDCAHGLDKLASGTGRQRRGE